MPREKYHKSYLEEQLPVEIREHLREDNLPPTRLPTYEYLNTKGFETRGLAKAIKRHFGEGETLDGFLKGHGFGVGGTNEWGTDDAETIRHLNGYRHSRRTRRDYAEPTIQTLESALREVIKTAQSLHQNDDLMIYARYKDEDEKYERNCQVEEILDTIKRENSDGAAKNYLRYFRGFYEYCSSRTRIDQNPVSQVEGQYRFDTTPNSEPQEISDEQARTIWETLKQLPERRELTDPVKNLVERYGLGEWQVQAMALIGLGVGAGPRSSEYVRMDCVEHWHFGDDPYIEFPIRKNLPGEVPIMAAPDFLKAYQAYLERKYEDWSGKPFPSDQSRSSSRTTNTLNNWLKAICKEANVRLDDGSLPTLQNLRQKWMNMYIRALRENGVHVEIVADEAGTKNERHVKVSYQTTEEERKAIRDLARGAFDGVFDLEELPEEMYTVLEKGEFVETQTDLSNF